MSIEHFAAVARSLIQRHDRRDIIARLLTAASIGPFIVARRYDPLEAKKKRKKKKCKKPKVKCGKKCCASGVVCTNSNAGICVTPSPTNPDPICAGIPSCCSTRQCGDDCLCQSTIEGGGFCYRPGAEGCGATCTSSADCPDGVCITYEAGTTCGSNTCCDGRLAVCVPNASRCT
jgi:hypothetical protein